MSSSGTEFDETLEWDGTDWTVHPGTGEGPGPREGPGFAWDPTSEQMVLFGGGSNLELPPETWAGTAAPGHRSPTAALGRAS